MKLINLNVEHDKYVERVMSFLEKENADVLVLQETTRVTAKLLEERGYASFFLPCMLTDAHGKETEDGTLVASKYPIEATTKYVHKPTEIRYEDLEDIDNTVSIGYIATKITVEDNIYEVVGAHGPWTKEGNNPSKFQTEIIRKMLLEFESLPPHILCGDMNVPRHYSNLYKLFVKQYKDEIPESYASSLDKSIHRLGDNPAKAILFTDYMVDYIFTQPPYKAENVRLEFGISDHAAVIADISKK